MTWRSRWRRRRYPPTLNPEHSMMFRHALRCHPHSPFSLYLPLFLPLPPTYYLCEIAPTLILMNFIIRECLVRTPLYRRSDGRQAISRTLNLEHVMMVGHFFMHVYFHQSLPGPEPSFGGANGEEQRSYPLM